MYLRHRVMDPKAEEFRRKAVATAASAAALASVPAIGFSHGHPVLGAAGIAAQVCLLIISLNYMRRMRDVASR